MKQENKVSNGFSFFCWIGRILFWPVRHWKITLILIIAYVILNIVAYQMLLSWTVEQKAILVEMRAAAKARGEATSLEDFHLNKLSDAENAAIGYQNANALFRFPEGSDFDARNIWNRYIAPKTYDSHQIVLNLSREKNAPMGPLTPDEEKWVDTFVASNEKAFKAVCDAGAIQACQFADYSDLSVALKMLSGETFFGQLDSSQSSTGPETAVFQKRLDSIRPLSQNIALRAVWEARHGNTEAAYEWVMRGLHLTNDLGSDPSSPLGIGRFLMTRTLMCTLNTILCETTWSGKLPDGFEPEMEQLTDRRVLVRCFEGKRLFKDVGVTSDFGEWPFPFIIKSQSTLYKVNSDFIMAAQEADPVKRRALLEQIDRYVSEDGTLQWLGSHNETKETKRKETWKDKWSSFTQLHKLFAGISAGDFFGESDVFDITEAQALIAQQTLSLKRYKQAKGHYPDQLQQLVPAELKALPRDPFNGDPFCYKKEGEGFLLYSVGFNRVDDSGRDHVSKKDGDIVWRVTQ